MGAADYFVSKRLDNLLENIQEFVWKRINKKKTVNLMSWISMNIQERTENVAVVPDTTRKDKLTN